MFVKGNSGKIYPEGGKDKSVYGEPILGNEKRDLIFLVGCALALRILFYMVGLVRRKVPPRWADGEGQEGRGGLSRHERPENRVYLSRFFASRRPEDLQNVFRTDRGRKKTIIVFRVLTR